MADALVIGAGAGGLTAAAYLAKAGRKVVVFEQDCRVGGTASVFRRSGFTFPAGPQSFTMSWYIAGVLRELGANERLDLIRDCFQVKRGSMDVMISVPLDELEEQLSGQFPGERDGIRGVTRVLEDVISALEHLAPDDMMAAGGTGNTARTLIERWGNVPAGELLDKHLKDRRLKDLLGSLGTGEAVMPVVLLAQMWRFMSKEGIWYARGGIDTVSGLLAGLVRAFGGDIRLGERVERILVKNGAVQGVGLAGGAIIRAPVVVSDADYKETFLRLLPADAVPQDYLRAITGMPLTPSVFTVFLGVKKDGVDLGAFRGHHLLVKLREGEPVPWEKKRPVAEDFLQDELWLTWWSRHDRGLAPTGCEALIIKVEAPYQPFSPLDGGGKMRHQQGYYRMKNEMADALIRAAAEVIPGLPGAVVVREVATPLTYRYWGHRTAGSVAGWSWRAGDVPGPWAQSLAVTPVKGLLMAGLQSFTRLFYGGMGTSIFSGRYASELVLSGDGFGRT